MVLLCRHPPQEAGEEVGAKCADGMRRYSAPQQPGKRIPTNVSVDLQQGVAFTLFLCQGGHSRPLASVHWAPHQRGPGIVEEVGVLDKDKKKIQDHFAAI